jgi:hypothetical protein
MSRKSGNRFSDEDMREQKDLEHPIRADRDALEIGLRPVELESGSAVSCKSPAVARASVQGSRQSGRVARRLQSAGKPGEGEQPMPAIADSLS